MERVLSRASSARQRAGGRPSHEAIDVQLKDFWAKETEARMAERGESIGLFVVIYQSRFEPTLTCLNYQVFLKPLTEIFSN